MMGTLSRAQVPTLWWDFSRLQNIAKITHYGCGLAAGVLGGMVGASFGRQPRPMASSTNLESLAYIGSLSPYAQGAR